MANTPVEFWAPSGLSLMLKVFPYGSDVLANTGGDAATEATNRKGLYTATVGESISGWHTAHVFDGSSNLIAIGDLYLEDDTDIHRVEDAQRRAYDERDGFNVKALVGDPQSLTDAKDFFDTGYDPATHKVQGVVLTDTTTDLTNKGLSNLDVAVSSRMATYTQPTGFLAASFPTDPADQSLIIAATDAITAAIAALNNLSSAQAQTAAAAALTAWGKTGFTLGTDGLPAAAVASAAGNKIADHVRRRTQENVENSSDGDTLDLSSEYGFIQQAQESAVVAGVLTVNKTDGTTPLGTKTVASNASADPVTGIS